MSQEYKMTATEREKQRQRMAKYRAKKRAEGGTINKKIDAQASQVPHRSPRQLAHTTWPAGNTPRQLAQDGQEESDGSILDAIAVFVGGVAILGAIIGIPVYIATRSQ